MNIELGREQIDKVLKRGIFLINVEKPTVAEREMFSGECADARHTLWEMASRSAKEAAEKVEPAQVECRAIGILAAERAAFQASVRQPLKALTTIYRLLRGLLMKWDDFSEDGAISVIQMAEQIAAAVTMGDALVIVDEGVRSELFGDEKVSPSAPASSLPVQP